MKIRASWLNLNNINHWTTRTTGNPLYPPFTFLAVLWATLFVAPVVSPQENRLPSPSFAPDRILVKPRPGVDLMELHAELGTVVLRSYPTIGGLQSVLLPPDVSVREMLVLFQQSGLVQYAEPDYILRVLLEPNDGKYQDGSLWGLKNTGQNNGMADADIDAPEAWNDLFTPGRQVIVAVIDTGVQRTHPDLEANMWSNQTELNGTSGIDDDGNGFVDDLHGWNAQLDSGDPNDDHGHGTHMSGIIAAVGNNNTVAPGSVIGVAWHHPTPVDVKIMACKFGGPAPNGLVSDAIDCIVYAYLTGAHVINAAWGDYVTGDSVSNPDGKDHGILDLDTSNFRSLYDAVAGAHAAGIIFVAACGNQANNNDRNKLFPASFSVDNIDPSTGQTLPALQNVIAVAATTRNDERWIDSSFGATTVHLGAPGLDIWSCGMFNDYASSRGTSQAAAYVSGACALVWTKYSTEGYQDIITRVLTAVDLVPSLAGKCRTGGRLNLYRALVPNGNGMWAGTGSMSTERLNHTATLLANGKVLVAGGFNGVSYFRGAELYEYDPATGTGTWTPTGDMTTARLWHTATLLPNGKVLVTGGRTIMGNRLRTAELFTYDPATGNGTWAPADSMTGAREGHTATLLSNGKVLVAGGSDGVALSTTELYDPTPPGTWTPTLPMTHFRLGHRATLLPNGKVLVSGGRNEIGSFLSSAELYDPLRF
jgi:subtilisin family serine protease